MTHEAMARAHARHGDIAERDAHWKEAITTSTLVENISDRRWLIRNIEGIKTPSVPEWE